MSEVIRLKKSNCKNCYKCIRSCAVKSIRFSGNQANIVSDECVLCGQCFVVCPQNAKEIVSEKEKIKIMLAQGKVVASVAPAFIANYKNIGIKELENALKKLGFFAAEETAKGATFVKNEYKKILEEQKPNILISSCCHSVNLLIQKYFPTVLPFLAKVKTPMNVHSLDLKKQYKDIQTVFIGPCVAKKDEAKLLDHSVDAVLSFEELTEWFKEENIVLENNIDNNDFSKTRLFPTTGGILKSMGEQVEGYHYFSVDGIENCIKTLRDIEQGNLSNCFIEMSACVGSCIGGPLMESGLNSPLRDFICVNDYAGTKDFEIETNDINLDISHEVISTSASLPSKNEIALILKQMGKTKPEHELNCGTCGYNTCKEKAVAVYQGKANLSMCLPFLKDKAESFSDNIIYNTPNGIIVLNENLEVQQINKAAKNMLNIRQSSDVLGEPVIRILDPTLFIEVRDRSRIVSEELIYLAEYDRFIEQTIIYDRAYYILICLMKDVTSEERQKNKKDQQNKQTAQIADKVIDKQMRVVQEIAMLLGETAAETKIALSKLKESISDE